MLDTLYYKDNYLKEFKTIVKECIKENNKSFRCTRKRK